jgi:hypothetical protein
MAYRLLKLVASFLRYGQKNGIEMFFSMGNIDGRIGREFDFWIKFPWFIHYIPKFSVNFPFSWSKSSAECGSIGASKFHVQIWNVRNRNSGVGQKSMKINPRIWQAGPIGFPEESTTAQNGGRRRKGRLASLVFDTNENYFYYWIAIVSTAYVYNLLVGWWICEG